MATKDRLDEFKVSSEAYMLERADSWSWEFPFDRSESSLFLFLSDYVESEDTDYEHELHFRPVQAFLSQVKGVQCDLKLLESYIEDVKIKHSQMMVDVRSDEKNKLELDHIVNAFQTLSESARARLKVLQDESLMCHAQAKAEADAAGSTEPPDSVTLRIRRAQVAALEKRMYNVLHLFNEEQARHRDRCKQRIQGYVELSGEELDEDAMEDVIESGQINIMAGGLLLRNSRQARQILADVEARAADIRKLEQSIRELHTMFLDVALMVETQGDMIDRIETNVTTAAEHVRKAAYHTKKAKEHKDRYRKRKICLALLCTILICIVCAILFFSLCEYVNLC